MSLTLNNKQVLAVRVISPYGRAVTDRELAQQGLAIGNNLDNDRRSRAFQWSRDQDGTLSRQYNIRQGRWPVYLVSDPAELKERFLDKDGREGKIIYTTLVNLDELRLGRNVAFEYQYPHSTEPLRKPDTLLRVEESDEGFHLVAETDRNRLQPDLRRSLDEEGRVDSFNGEYFLDNFQNPNQLEGEKIFRFVDGKYKDITDEVHRLRKESNEAQREITDPARRL